MSERKNLSRAQRQKNRVGKKGAYAMEIPEIAGCLGLSETTVKDSLKSAITKLQDGRAEKFRDLMIARDQEKRHGLPSLPDRISMTMRNGQ